MKVATILFSVALAVSTLSIAGCDNYPDYPPNAQPMPATDLHKSGNGYYGGTTPQQQSKRRPGGPSSTSPNATSSAPASSSAGAADGAQPR